MQQALIVICKQDNKICSFNSFNSFKKISKIAKLQGNFKSQHFFIPQGPTKPIEVDVEHLYVPGHLHALGNVKP